MKWFERFAATLSLTTLVVCAHGQEGPAQDPEGDEPEAKVLWNRYEIEIPGWSFRGNRNKLRQYASPARGFVLRGLELLYPATEDGRFARVSLRGFPDQDSASDGRLIADGGRFDVSLSQTTHRFYDPTPLVIDASQDRKTELNASYAITPEIGAFYRFQQRERDLTFDPPKDRTDTRTKKNAAGLEGELLGGRAEFTVADNRVYDQTGETPDSVRHRIDASYARDLGPALSVHGAYSRTQIEQQGLQDSEVRSWAFGANWMVGPSTSLFVNVRNDDLEMPNVENAYVQERFFSGARLVHRFRGSSLQLAYRHRESERLRGDQAFVDVPKWDTYEAKLSGRLSPSVRYSLRSWFEHLSRRATMVTQDPRALYWDDRFFGQARLEGGSDRFHGYATYTYRVDQNTPRDVEIRQHNFTVGGFYVFNDSTNAYLEVANQTFKADLTGEMLDEFFPSSTSFALGVSHAVSPLATLSLAATHFVTRNDNPLQLRDGNVRGTEISATYERSLGPDSSFSVFVAPWRYTDRLVEQMDYRSTVVGVRFATKF